MLLVKLDGGLGNQMFQYAFGKQFSVQYSIPLKLDIFKLFEYRKFELAVFKFHQEIATKEDLLFFDRQHLSLSKKVLFKIKNCNIKAFYLSEREGVENYTFLKKTPKYVLISGHWQSESYFKNIENIIRLDFSFPNITAKKNITYCSLIQQTNSVSVHIRRGDYLLEQNNKVHGVLPLQFYRQAIEYIVKKTFNPVFFIFSDDADWAIENLDFKGKFYFVTGNESNHAYVDMQLMSYCKHNIIANSSFSWWGAWLNNYQSKIVIAPKQWFADPVKNSFNKNIIPKEWISL